MTPSLKSKLDVIELVNSSLLSFVELRMQCRMCILQLPEFSDHKPWTCNKNRHFFALADCPQIEVHELILGKYVFFVFNSFKLPFRIVCYCY